MASELLLEGKIALVTGAGRGVGYAIADRLLAGGAKVALHYHSSKGGVSQLAERYGEERCYLIEADFATPFSSEQVFNSVWSWEQRIDILVNNAALIEPVESIEQISEDHLICMMQVNFVAPFLLSKMVVGKMRRARSGRVVSISSIGVKYAGSPQTTHYMTSKAALEAGMLALAKTASGDGVLVNVIRAGVTRTSAHKRLGRHDLAPREALIPLGRAAEADEIAEAVLFLVSPRNTYITGVILPVAGGE